MRERRKERGRPVALMVARLTSPPKESRRTRESNSRRCPGQRIRRACYKALPLEALRFWPLLRPIARGARQPQPGWKDYAATMAIHGRMRLLNLRSSSTKRHLALNP